MFSKIRGKTSFQVQWMESFPWVQPVQGNPYAAKCKLCNSAISIESMGRTALTSHAEGKKHQSRIGSSSSSVPVLAFVKTPSQQKAISPKRQNNLTKTTDNPDDQDDPPLPISIYEPSTSKLTTVLEEHRPEETSTNHPSLTAQPLSTTQNEEPPKKKIKTSMMETFLNKEKVTKAEILWTLHCVNTHISLRAAGSTVSLFKRMFPEDEVAQKMQLQKTKISYLVVHGLGPYFEKKLRDTLKPVKHLVIGFDESLNKIAQKQQMDVTVRYWDEEKEMVIARYLTSQFLEHATAEHLLQGLKTALRDINRDKILQISMDGPNVNHKMIRLWKDEAGDGTQLLDLGSCGLHTMHCAFKNAIKSTNWKVVEFLRALYNLFKDVPSRRGEFKCITGSSTFPLKFCAIRWLENAHVAERALQILSHVEEYVMAVKGSKKEPKCNSFTIIETALKNKLLRAELAFFQALAEKTNPFLKDFQTDSPMVPFLHTAICSVLSSVMQQIATKEVFDATEVTKIDVTKEENLKSAKQIILGFGTKSAIRDCKNVSDKEIYQFRKECKNCLKVFITHTMEKSPLKQKLTKCVTCFDPQTAQENDSNFSGLLDIFVKSKIMKGSDADKALLQFTTLTSKVSINERLQRYKRSEQRLDELWLQVLNDMEHDPKELREVVKIVLTLSHGNAGVERGFSINKDCLVPNQTEESLVAQRTVIESVSLLGGVENIQISKEIIHAARNARARYEECLLKQKKKQEEEKKSQDDKKRSAAMIKELLKEKQRLMEETHRKVEAIDEQVQALKK